MKHKKIKLSFIIILILISIVHIYYNKNYNESIIEYEIVEEENNITKIKRRHPQIPFTIFGIYVEKIDEKSHDPIIKAILGFTPDSVFDNKRAINEFTLSSGASLYEITPFLPHKGNVRFYVTTNTEDQSIESIRIIQSLNTLEEAQIEMEKVKSIVDQKFHLLSQGKDTKYYKNQYNSLLILYIKPVNKHFELRLHHISSHNII